MLQRSGLIDEPIAGSNALNRLHKSIRLRYIGLLADCHQQLSALQQIVRFIPPLLLSSIRAYPDEDGPRSQLAQWYSHKGDPRGDFITTQLRRAKLDAMFYDLEPHELTEYQQLIIHESNLRREYETEWLAELTLQANEVIWERGLPDQITVSWQRFGSSRDTILNAVTRRLALCQDKKRIGRKPAMLQIAKLSDSPHFLFPELDLSHNQLGSSFLDLLESPHLRELQRLSINSNALTNEGVRELSKLSFKRLNTLDLAANQIQHGGATTIANSPNLGTLKRLTLWANRFHDDGAQALSQPDVLPMLEALDISGNQLSHLGAQFIAQGALSTHLQELDLSVNEIGDQGLQALARGSWPFLTSLRVADCSLTPDAVAALTSTEWSANLQTLDLYHNFFGHEALRFLTVGRQLKSLVSLNLSSNSIYADGAPLLADLQTPSLRSLDLSYNVLGSEGAAVLSQSTIFKNLRTLDLSYNELGDEGLRLLANSPHLASLRELNLEGNQVSFEGALALVQSRSLNRLFKVHLEKEAAPEIIDLLRQKFIVNQ